MSGVGVPVSGVGDRQPRKEGEEPQGSLPSPTSPVLLPRPSKVRQPRKEGEEPQGSLPPPFKGFFKEVVSKFAKPAEALCKARPGRPGLKKKGTLGPPYLPLVPLGRLLRPGLRKKGAPGPPSSPSSKPVTVTLFRKARFSILRFLRFYAFFGPARFSKSAFFFS